MGMKRDGEVVVKYGKGVAENDIFFQKWNSTLERGAVGSTKKTGTPADLLTFKPGCCRNHPGWIELQPHPEIISPEKGSFPDLCQPFNRISQLRPFLFLCRKQILYRSLKVHAVLFCEAKIAIFSFSEQRKEVIWLFAKNVPLLFGSQLFLYLCGRFRLYIVIIHPRCNEPNN